MNADQSVTTETDDAPKLEREICSRCGGTGSYSYCEMWGTRCFKCQGRKVVLTKRGAAASAYLTPLRSRRADELKPGDRVHVRARGWVTVKAVRPGRVETDGGQVVDGQVIPPQIVIEFDRLTYHTSPDAMFRVFVSKEHERETLLAAIEYQNSLTVAGKPRKRAAK